jgi:hypothetical protein
MAQPDLHPSFFGCEPTLSTNESRGALGNFEHIPVTLHQGEFKAFRVTRQSSAATTRVEVATSDFGAAHRAG